MISQLKFLEKIDWSHYWRSNNLNQAIYIHESVDINKLENLISLESVGETCYQSISYMIHNQSFRRECQKFGEKTKFHQDELRKIFSFTAENESSIENKKSKYLLQLEPSYLPIRSVINLVICITSYKMDAYRRLCYRVHEHHSLLSGFANDTVEEMRFLRNEKKIYVRETWGTDIKISLD